MFMQAVFRWYGPEDPVPLHYIAQAGAEGVVTSLHQIPYGEVWSKDAIQERQRICNRANLPWLVVESLPVHEDIKLMRGNFRTYIDNYCQSLQNLGKCGIRVITYNFMPVLDWIRTDLNYRMPDGSETLYFNRVQFAAFELFLLQRPGAENDWPLEVQVSAKQFIDSLSSSQRESFTSGIIDNFPGFKGMTIAHIKAMLQKYDDIGEEELRGNLKYFLDRVAPVAEENNCVLTIHPDDPPFPILGLPRIFSKQEDIASLAEACPNSANGICFCSGSFSGRLDNDIIQMFRQAASRTHFLHLRSTAHDQQGNFWEAGHLEGRVDMYQLIKEIIAEQLRRRDSGEAYWRIPFRPDHGRRMMDDLNKPPAPNPGYTAIGRMKGLAELRGLELGILRGEYPEVIRNNFFQ